ncbi:hypothetical protein [Schumannella sp. 10F1B-5-1]|uniref:hypothetical protein n=1 Tax=Schumannella sp. 10F1B-5-1 TaxID=2590780 RepID=UPI0011324AB8|nr:hypothetical protein [Schumannella sp. 10F1B-5-1]TPW76721.1 hypothetical protein FJ658_01905 [Schumannella sp. 10F1B-5-1]
MIDDDELDARLTRTRREIDPSDGLVTGVAAASVRRRGRARRRRLAWGGGIAALALLLGGVTAPAAADAIRQFLAQTGQTCSGGECGEGSEVIDLNAPDVDEYAASLYPDYVPVPPGTTRDAIIQQVSSEADLNRAPGLTTESGFVMQYEIAGYCGWVGDWLAAEKKHDTQRRDAATQVIVASTAWPNLNAGDAGKINALVAGAAQSGDAEGIRFAAQLWACPASRGFTTSYGDWLGEQGYEG